MPLTDRVLNRTLWVRQQLVAGRRTPGLGDPVAMSEHLLGLQAQETLPPYLSLAARIADFDPRTLSDAIRARDVVRVLSMRGTVHVLSAADALAVRPWVQDMLERASAGQVGVRPAAHVTTGRLMQAATEALRSGPLSLDALGEHLVRACPDVPVPALRAAARARLPLVQVPPRGLWRRSGGVVYDLLSSWLGEAHVEIDLPALVRRYLHAFGPASPADMTKWSGVTRLGPVFTGLGDELTVHVDERGRRLNDVADGEIADADLELPPLMLGRYDNLWLSHADRSRIATDDKRHRWTGKNGGLGAGIFVDGMLEGYWNRSGDDLAVTPFRRYTKTEQSGLDTEIARIRAFLRIEPADEP